jgi:hypothetical protein
MTPTSAAGDRIPYPMTAERPVVRTGPHPAALWIDAGVWRARGVHGRRRSRLPAGGFTTVRIWAYCCGEGAATPQLST